VESEREHLTEKKEKKRSWLAKKKSNPDCSTKNKYAMQANDK
jgi:hypothetical protein